MIPLNESTNLNFSLNIVNANNPLQKARVVIEADGYEIGIPFTIEKGEANVQVPVLEGVLPPGKHKVRMELVIGGVLYTPFFESLEFGGPAGSKVIQESKKASIEAIKKAANRSIQEAFDRKIADSKIDKITKATDITTLMSEMYKFKS